MAAAFFNSATPGRWKAMSAGVEPADALSPTAEALLAGMEAAKFLDHSSPRPIKVVDEPRRVIALRNPSIQYELESDESWDLTSSAGQPLRDEIRDRALALARGIAAQERGDS
jgi:hypothetical protein